MVTHIVGRSFNEGLIIFGINIYSVVYSVRMKLKQNLFLKNLQYVYNLGKYLSINTSGSQMNTFKI